MSIDVTNMGVTNKRVFCLSGARETGTSLRPAVLAENPEKTTELNMTIKLHNPPGIAPPFSCYSHGASAQGDARWLYVSGQVGVTTDGVVPDDPEKQIELAWDNLLAVLADAGMTVKDLVKIDGFITRPDLVPFYRKERERRFAGHAAATTMVIVAGLAEPNLLVEIQAVAAM